MDSRLRGRKREGEGEKRGEGDHKGRPYKR